MGCAREYHVDRFFREIRIARVAPVSARPILCHFAERVLGLPK
jgi:acyl-CoA dehydrogenase